jgi:magnesium transporter
LFRFEPVCLSAERFGRSSAVPFFSILGRRPVVDERGRRAKVVDFVVDLLGAEHPPVTRVLLRTDDGETRALPGDAVRGVGGRPYVTRVADLDAAEPAGDDARADEVWLGRDVLDALVLDLENRRATRANDLIVEETSAGLALTAADTGLRAILRRLTRGTVALAPSPATLYDWKYVEFLRGDAKAVDHGAGYHLRIARLPPGDIAGLAAAVPYRHAAELLTLLPDALATDTLEVMDAQRQLQVFEELETDRADRLLALMAPDAAADLVGRLHPATARERLERLPAARRARVVNLLRYPEDSVGGVMTDDVIVAPADWTVAEARERLRERLREPDFIYFVYVVADERSRKLRGVITLRDVLVADDDRTLGEIANPYLVTLRPLEPAINAAFKLLDSQLTAIPVVGEDMGLVGALTVDAAVGLAAPGSWRAQAPRVFS